tara:strand:- start:4330 stop:5094 length:765 start_codon:yes stop_codon:yes gene_type:complete
MAILLRSGKGSALTHPELDANFTTLQAADLDSAAVTLIAQALDNALPMLDSAAVTLIAQSLDSDLPIGDADTLQSVVDRGATVTTAATFSGGITTTGITTTGAGTPGITSASAVTITTTDAINLEPGAGEVVKMGGNVDLGTSGSTIQHQFVMTADGTSNYVFNDAGSNWFPVAENDPVLYLRRGETYVFQNSSGGSHPFEIRVSSGGAAYSTGVTNNAGATGLIVFTVPMSAPATLYYQCTNHASMGNTINIV